MDRETIRAVMAELGRRRTKKLSPQERGKISSRGGKAAWARLTKDQRSAEMKRRAAVRKRNRARKSKS
ncbi:MAG: hypothetical protein WAN81_23240 [Candidatus Binataceae bacterium]